MGRAGCGARTRRRRLVIAAASAVHGKIILTRNVVDFADTTHQSLGPVIFLGTSDFHGGSALVSQLSLREVGGPQSIMRPQMSA
jgi:hypothetical protein